MAKRTVADVDVAGKRVMIRVDFNVPLDKKTGAIADDRRIRGALPTISNVLHRGGSVICMSHLGRPSGDPAKDKFLTMDRVAERLAEVLGVPVTKAADVAGPSAAALAAQLRPGQVLVLENLRFDDGEKDGDEGFAKRLAALADIYVNDAFGTCHRTDASMYAVPQQFPPGARVVGMLVEKELNILQEILGQPQRPFIALMGGAKVSDKIGFIEALLGKVDKILVGGAMAYTFRKSQGQPVGNSLVENDKLDLARALLAKAGDKLVLPMDNRIATSPDAAAVDTQVVQGAIPDGWEGFDIGPATIAEYQRQLSGAKTIVWNGPMGMFEKEPFRAGTIAMAQVLADTNAVTVVGGGESADAVTRFGFDDRITHVSTGGGAFLEYVEGKPFAPLTVIDEK